MNMNTGMNMGQPRSRRGITLTEILISIMIMGVGLVSLATLFPVGMERLRRGQRNSRSALLRPAAIADIDGKKLLAKPLFDAVPWYGFVPHPAASGSTGMGYDPWLQDLPLPTGATPVGGPVPTGTATGVYRGRGVTYTFPWGQATEVPKPGEGLPVCYDPMWWAIAFANDPSNLPPYNGPYPAYNSAIVSRFGRSPSSTVIAGTPGNPPNNGDGNAASAYGLQRLTNAWPLNSSVVFQTFASPDDMVLQDDGELTSQPFTDTAANEIHTPWVKGSPILPTIDLVTDSGSGALKRIDQTYDYSFSWMFTGRRTSGLEDTNFIGDLVVLHNRPFALDEWTDPLSGTTYQTPAGERVVEAVFGYGGTPRVASLTGFVAQPVAMGYSPNTRTVLLRWNNANPDPDVRVGGWIADVTYEQFSGSEGRFTSALFNAVPTAAEFYPAQRCHWYRVVRKGQIEDEIAGVTAAPSSNNYRRMVVTIEDPVKSKTLVWGTTAAANAGSPVFTNVALVSPYVVNVFPVSFRME